MSSEDRAKYGFLFSNLFKGLLWLAVILFLFYLAKNHFETDYYSLMAYAANKPILVLLIFTASEIFFGIITPELFMIWSLHQGTTMDYVLFVLLLSSISYLSGILGYYFGQRFSNTIIYRRIIDRIGNNFEDKVKKYGGLMIFIGAVTPVPFSGMCMLSGAAKFNFYLFLLISTSRIARFGLYAYVVWQVNLI